MTSCFKQDDSNTKLQELNSEEAYKLFESVVKANLKMSAAEFLDRYRKGEYENKDACDNPRLLKVLMMVPQGL